LFTNNNYYFYEAGYCLTAIRQAAPLFAIRGAIIVYYISPKQVIVAKKLFQQQRFLF
jgi:hypothetical protein